MTPLKWSLRFICLVGVLTVGCSETGEDPVHSAQEGPDSVAPVFAEHRFNESLKRDPKSVGEDCSVSGRGECESGVCLHTGTEPGAGYVCSRTCTSPTECPPDWRCAQVQPGAGTRLCIPSAS
jgi:hypothetical protein